MTQTAHTLESVHSTIASPIGELLLVARGDALSAVYFPAHRHQPDATGFGHRGSTAVLAEAGRQLTEYFDGRLTEFDLPMAPVGNPFQHRVWELLQQMPYGVTRSYGDIASELGDIGLARAVGAANGRNPISIVVPCHRVIGSSGKLVGYGGGLERKQYLLALESRTTPPPDSLF